MILDYYLTIFIDINVTEKCQFHSSIEILWINGENQDLAIKIYTYIWKIKHLTTENHSKFITESVCKICSKYIVPVACSKYIVEIYRLSSYSQLSNYWVRALGIKLKWYQCPVTPSWTQSWCGSTSLEVVIPMIFLQCLSTVDGVRNSVNFKHILYFFLSA